MPDTAEGKHQRPDDNDGASTEVRDPQETDHPTGDEQAARNRDTEPPG